MPADTLDKMTKDELKQYCRELKTTHEKLYAENQKLNKLVNALLKVIVFFFGSDAIDKLL